jgi:hypothetical protein
MASILREYLLQSLDEEDEAWRQEKLRTRAAADPAWQAGRDRMYEKIMPHLRPLKEQGFKCTVVVQSGKRKGQKCGAPISINPLWCSSTCRFGHEDYAEVMQYLGKRGW